MSAVTEIVNVRPYREGDADTFSRIDELAFGYTMGPNDHQDDAVLDHRRSLIAEIGEDAVGIASAYQFTLSVPGGAQVPTAGVTWVGVLPTHRRRGVVRALMEHQLRAIKDLGEPIAALWASEPGIYGRFGYGLASRSLHVHVPSRSLTPRAPHDPSLRVRLVAAADARPAMAQTYAAMAAQRPGVPARSEPWWDRALHDPADRRGGLSERRVVLAEDQEGVRGYALFATKSEFGADHTPTGTVQVREIVGLDAAATAALWKVLLEHDLMTTVDWPFMPSDDPLLLWLDNVRPVVGALLDSLWLRIIDLPAALAVRAYSGASSTVLEVHDAVLGDNDDRWRLETHESGKATCEPSTDAADIVLDIRDLGAVYLGSTELADLAAAGLVVANDDDVLHSVSTALRHRPAAWCPHIF